MKIKSGALKPAWDEPQQTLKSVVQHNTWCLWRRSDMAGVGSDAIRSMCCTKVLNCIEGWCIGETHSGLCFLLLLLALFQKHWRLEFLFLLGRGFARRALRSPALRFSGRSCRRGGVVGCESLHPFLQFFCQLLLLLASILHGGRVCLCLHFCKFW